MTQKSKIRKWLHLVVILIVLTVGACSSKSPSVLGKDPSGQVIKALQHNDFSLIQPLLLTEQDIDGMAQHMIAHMNNNQFSAERIDKETKLLEEQTRRFKKDINNYTQRMQQAFEQVRNKADTEGVDWKDVKIVSKREKLSDSHLGSEKVKIFVLLQSGKSRYMLELGKYLKSDRGLIMVDSLDWKGRIGQAVSTMEER